MARKQAFHKQGLGKNEFGNAARDTSKNAKSSTTPIILDVDTGRDDVWTMMGVFNENLPLDSVIVSYGNAALNDTNANTSAVIEFIHEKNPSAAPDIWVGERHPLVLNHENEAELARRAGAGHGGLFHVPINPAKKTPVSMGADWEHGFSQLLRARAALNGPVDYICCGPLTNLAEIISAMGADDAKKSIRRVIAVGGSFDPETSADFNFMADPKAVDIVIKTFGKDLTVIPFDDTKKLALDKTEIDSLAPATSQQAFAKALMHAHAATMPGYITRLHDPTALLAIHNKLPTSLVKVRVKQEPPAAGKLLLDDAGGVYIRRTHIEDANIPTIKKRILKNILKYP